MGFPTVRMAGAANSNHWWISALGWLHWM